MQSRAEDRPIHLRVRFHGKNEDDFPCANDLSLRSLVQIEQQLTDPRRGLVAGTHARLISGTVED